jgi:uncharacterized protein YecA (UPF0149 family)
MPTRTFYRIWCKTCNEFELHTNKDEQYICEECGTVYTDILLGEIPKEKRIEQRERYNKRKRKNFINIFDTFTNYHNMFKEEIGRTEIMESDAGQKYIDDKNKEKYEQYKKEAEEKKALQKQYSKLGRNEKCFCGSGIKFKKCCYAKIF